MLRSVAPVLAAALLLAGCGGGGTPPAPAPGCTPACAGRQCGTDGCGGSCGSCAGGASCSTQGACVAPPPSTSVNCPAGRYCAYEIHVQYQYTCYGELCPDETRVEIARFGDTPAPNAGYYCRTDGCQGGNSTCGTQNNVDNDPACRACQAACIPSVGWESCRNERPGNLCRLSDRFGEYDVECTCR